MGCTVHRSYFLAFGCGNSCPISVFLRPSVRVLRKSVCNVYAHSTHNTCWNVSSLERAVIYLFIYVCRIITMIGGISGKAHNENNDCMIIQNFYDLLNENHRINFPFENIRYQKKKKKRKSKLNRDYLIIVTLCTYHTLQYYW